MPLPRNYDRFETACKILQTQMRFTCQVISADALTASRPNENLRQINKIVEIQNSLKRLYNEAEVMRKGLEETLYVSDGDKYNDYS